MGRREWQYAEFEVNRRFVCCMPPWTGVILEHQMKGEATAATNPAGRLFVPNKVPNLGQIRQADGAGMV